MILDAIFRSDSLSQSSAEQLWSSIFPPLE